MRRPFARGWVIVAATALLAACGSAPSSSPSATDFVSTTPKAAGALDRLEWNLFYEPLSLDPAHSGNYSENEVIANLCDNLLRIEPDYSIAPGLAVKYSNPSPTTWVYDLAPNATFWDGHPVTTDDVVFSLRRNLDPKVGSYFAQYYANVQDITATGPHQVTVTLKQPDVQFNPGMATAGGAILEKAYTDAKGSSFGSASGGVMCSGPFKFDGWSSGNSITIVGNDGYWDAALRPKVKTVVFRFVADESTEANALLSGQLQGMYQAPLSALARLQRSKSGHLYFGKSMIQFDVAVSATSGPMADPRIRRALSMAIDRAAISQTVFQGAATPARTLATPGTWSYAKPTFQAAWDALPGASTDVAGAKKLVKEAGSPTTPITLAYPSGGQQTYEQIADVVQSAAKSIGLTVTLKGIPRDTYGNIFFDAKMRQGVDALETTWYTDIPEPLNLYDIFIPGQSIYNFDKYDNPKVSRELTQATQTEDPAKRAPLVVAAQSQIMRDLPWIPIVDMANLLYLDKSVTGTPASFVDLYYPWLTTAGKP